MYNFIEIYIYIFINNANKHMHFQTGLMKNTTQTLWATKI